MLKFVVLEKGRSIPVLDGEAYGHSFKVFNCSLDAWSHLLQKENAADYRVAQIDIQVISISGDIE